MVSISHNSLWKIVTDLFRKQRTERGPFLTPEYMGWLWTWLWRQHDAAFWPNESGWLLPRQAAGCPCAITWQGSQGQMNWPCPLPFWGRSHFHRNYMSMGSSGMSLRPWKCAVDEGTQKRLSSPRRAYPSGSVPQHFLVILEAPRWSAGSVCRWLTDGR